jgi:hypothetical protein
MEVRSVASAAQAFIDNVAIAAATLSLSKAVRMAASDDRPVWDWFLCCKERATGERQDDDF